METAPMGNSEFDDVAARLLELLDTIADLQRTLEALADQGVVVGDSVTGTATDAERVLDDISEVGVDLEDVFGVLENDGVAKFATSWQQLLDAYPASAGTAEDAQGRGEPDR
jgi:transaldolase